MIRHMTFKSRFIALALVFLLGYAALVVVGGRTLHRVRIGGELYGEVIEKKDLIADVLPPPNFIVEPYLLCYIIATTRSADERRALVADLRASIEAYRASHRFWEEHLEDPALRANLIGAAHDPAEQFFDLAERAFLPAVEDPSSAEAPLDILVGTLDPLFDEHRAAIERTVGLAQARIDEAEAAATRATRRGNLLMLTVAVVFIAIIGAAGGWLARNVLGTLRMIIERMQEMAEAEADLTARLDIDARDEVGELARWFDALLEKFATLVKQVQASSIRLGSTANEVAATSRHQRETITSLGASTSQIAAATHEISATGTELLSTMNEVRGIAQTSATAAAEGRRGLSDMQSTMSSLGESGASISSKLAAINEKTRDITSIVTTINKVADQTNLLSVNAALEAEKAGEYGRGFLIVAREIRRLADQTAGATLDIEQTVDQMQAAVSTGVTEADRFGEQMRRTVHDVDQVGRLLGEIIGQVETVTQRFESVGEGMTSQADGVQQINDAMVSLSDNVQKTTASLGDFAAAAEGMRDAVTDMRRELEKFKTGD